MDFERRERFISSKCKFYFNLNDNAKMIKTSNYHRIEQNVFRYNNSMKLKDVFLSEIYSA